MGVALITGASAGLGYEFAKLFAADGHSVILVARRKQRLEEIADELKASYPNIRTWIIGADLGKPGAGSQLFHRMKELEVSIDFLVNNAGFATSGNFADLPLDREMEMIDLNIRTLTELTHLCLPGMIARGSGYVLNIGSTAGFQPGPFMATYFASKAFVVSFSEALNEELQGTGVSCTVLAPGATATEFAKTSGADKAALFTKNKVATASEVARAGYDAMKERKSLKIHGFLNLVMMQSLRIAPRAIVKRMVARLNAPQL